MKKIAFLFFITLYFLNILYQHHSHHPKLDQLNLSNSRKIRILDGKFYKAQIFNEPILFKNVPRLKNWKPMQWSPEYLTLNAEHFKSVYVHHKKSFLYYDDEKPFASYLLPRFFKNKEVYSVLKDKSMDPYTFFTHLYQQDETKEYYYFSNQIGTLGKKLNNEVGSLDFLQVTNQTITRNLWIGKGSITHIHYDAAHNTFVQIYGKKKFLLYEPKEWINLNLYSSLHPCHRQGQMDNPILKELPPFEVDIEAGDILYLPPYWFHHVIADDKDISVSFNIWSDCIENIKSNELSYLPIPIEKDWEKSKQISVVRDYLSEIIKSANSLEDSLFKNMDVKEYIEKTMISRLNDPILKQIFSSNFNGN